MREAKERFLAWEVERIKDLLLSLEPCILKANDGVAKYFKNAHSSLCDELDAYDALNKLPDLYRQLAEHDRRFSDGDQSKFDPERASIVQKLRGCEELIYRKRRQVERYQLIDLTTIKAVDAFMDDRGFDHDDYFRPSNFLHEPRQWSTSDLNKLEAEAILWREKIVAFMSQSEDKVILDFRTFLGLVLREVEKTRKFLDLTEQFDDRQSQLLFQKGDFASSCTKFALECSRKYGGITVAQFSEEMAKLEAIHFSQSVADEELLRLSVSRAALTAEICKVRSEIAERAGIFLCALNFLDIPPTSYLREALDFAAAKQPESEQERKERRMAAKDKRFVLAIGQWWEKWHKDNAKVSVDAWDHLKRLLLVGDFELNDFVEGKVEIKRLIGAVRTLEGHSDGIVRWSDVISFVTKRNSNNAALRRILLKRFSDIYNLDYLPLQELNKLPSIS